MIDLNALKEATNTSDFVKLENDGDTVTFFIPESSTLQVVKTVWTGSGSREANDQDDPANIKTRCRASVMEVLADGKIVRRTFEQSNATWGKLGAKAQKEGGSLHDHVYSVERVGDKGDKKTSYRVKIVGKASDYAGKAPDAAQVSFTEDFKVKLATYCADKKMSPAAITAMLAVAAPGAKSLLALTPDQAKAVYEQVSA